MRLNTIDQLAHIKTAFPREAPEITPFKTPGSSVLSEESETMTRSVVWGREDGGTAIRIARVDREALVGPSGRGLIGRLGRPSARDGRSELIVM